MKNLYLKIAFFAVTALGFSGNLFAAQANGTAGALVVTPVTVTENAATKLHFGDFTVGTVGGTVTVSQAGIRTGGADIGLLTVGTTTTPSQGQFDVTGDAARAITVTIDFTGATLTDGGVNTMTVAANGADAAPPVALAAGAATVSVGGVLTVGASQVAASYSTGNAGGVPYTVTVNYQ